jgi:hypothetical protein
MEIETDDTIHYNVELVYETLRDRLPEIVPYLPNVESVETVEREDLEEGPKLLNIWTAKASEAPAVARPFIKPEMLKWKDYATWHDEDSCVDWRLETFYMSGLFTCSGTNYIEEVDENSCELLITGNLEVHTEVIPGIPNFLRKTVKPAIERFIVGMITPNLQNLAKGLVEFLDHEREEEKQDEG